MVYVGDVGTTISIDVGEDITGGLSYVIKYRKPDKTTGIWTGVLRGTRFIDYVTVAGDIDQGGRWRIQGFVTLSAANIYHTVIGELPVSLALVA